MADIQNFANLKTTKMSSGNYLEGLNIDSTLYKIHDPLLDDVITALDTNFGELESRINGKMDNRSVIGATEAIVAGSTSFVEAGAIYTALSQKADTSSLKTVATTGNYSDLSGTPDLSHYIDKDVNDLTYYYTKTQTDTQITTAVNSAVNGVKQFNYQVVSELPTADETSMYKIYLKPLSSADGTDNVYEEYLCIDKGEGQTPRYAFELIGTTRTSLSGYVTDSSLATTLQDYVTSAGLTTTLGNYVTKEGLTTELAKYQEKLKFDAAPTEGSTAPVTSGGIYTALTGKADNNAVVKKVNGVAPTNGNITINGASAPVLQNASVSQNSTTNYYTWNVNSATLSFLTGVQGQS